MSYYLLLKENRTVRILTTVQIIAYFGSWFSHVAVLALLAGLGASPLLISIAVSMSFLPALIQGPFVGAIIDRLKPKPLMLFLLFIEALCTAGFILIEAKEHIWFLLILVYIKMGAASFYFTSEMSLLPKLLSTAKLKSANEIHSIVWSACFTIGVALSGIAVEYFGIKIAFFIDVVLFLAAIAVFSTLQIGVKPEPKTTGFIDTFLDGLSYVFKKNPKILFIIFLHASVGLTVFDGIITVLAQTKYKEIISVALAIGFLGAIRSLALVIGPFLFSKIVNKERLFYLLLAQGIAAMLWGVLSDNFWTSLVGSFVCGLFTTTVWSYTMTMLQDAIDDGFYGRVVGINDMFFTATAAATSIGIGFLLESGVSGGWALGVMGILFVIVAFYYKNGIKNFS